MPYDIPDFYDILTEDYKTVVWDINSGDAVSQMPCACLCYPNLYPDPSSRCQKLPCTNECPAPSPTWAPTKALTANFITRNQVRITDPDHLNYGFDLRLFTLNISCMHGRLFLNEYFFVGEKRCTNDFSLCRLARDCIIPGGGQPGQCSTNSPLITPQAVDSIYQVGLQHSPTDFGVGNQVLSLSGTMKSLNLALAGLVYVGDPYFNTMLADEAIFGTVDDNGAISSLTSEPGLTYDFFIITLVRSVNNPVQIGMRPGTALLPVNSSINQRCFSIPPSGAEYSAICGPGQRHYIDVDEDTPFTITPDILWMDDVDSEDAVLLNQRATLQYACADPASENDCTCNQPCKCGEVICTCDQPAACDVGDFSPGMLLIQMSVSNGMLTLQPPPGRSQVDTMFFTKVTDQPIGTCLAGLGTIIYDKLAACYKPCSNQKACAVNASSLLFTIRLKNLKLVLQEKYLTYQAKLNYYGFDTLSIWAIDQGYTDSFYDYRRSIAAASVLELMIRVVGVNDPPTVTFPNYVLRYQGNQPCYVDYMQFKTAINCPYVSANPMFYNFSSIPPLDGPLKAAALSRGPASVPYITFADVDMDGTIYGNMTLLIQIGDPQTGYAGRFTINEVHPMVDHFQYFNSKENRGYLQLDGRLENINILMRRIFFDPNPSFQGICPFYLLAFDNNNFGECNGDHACGYSFPCDDPLQADAHTPSQSGQGKASIDVIAGGSALCGATTCDSCAKAGDCGWCHGTCHGVGKCMIGKNAPKFESCESNASIGLAYGQCSTTPSSLLPVIGAGVAAFLIFLLVALYFKRFISRRHGSIGAYLKKLSLNLSIITSRLNLGNSGKEWRFKVTVLICILASVFIAEMLLSMTDNPACDYNQEFFLDTATQVVLDVDYCQIRFLSPNHFTSPRDNQITAMKLKFAILEDPSIVLNANTCQSDGGVTISIQNSKPLAVRYKNYFCNILLLVPDKLIIPSTYIQDMHGFATNIRSGSMDYDSPDFNLNFGPNTFSISGLYVNARLRGVNAKHFFFDVTKGQLFAEEVTALFASATSVEADLAMTSPVQTSLSFWQRDGNKVCMTAANNSLYVDNSCASKCEYLPVRAINYTNISVASLTQANCTLDTVLGAWNSLSNPPVCELICPSLKRPIVPGCVDTTACTVAETPICLCKPFCDMVPPSLLSYSGTSGVPGQCNAAGQCCRVVCAGFSRADLFPDENEPRDGLTAAGTAKPWKPNGLQQQWTLSSDRGVISLQVLSAGVPAVNSWKGGNLSASIDLVPALGTTDMDALDHLFHPGGANAPKADLFYILLSGAGTPEVSSGHFEWLLDTRYLMISPWLLRVVSFGLLRPQLQTSTGRLSSGFCPNTALDEFTLDTRLIRMYSLLMDTLQNYPPGQPAKPLPTGSFVAFKNQTGPSVVFSVDPQTGAVYLEAFDPSQHYLLTLITIFALIFPLLVALFVTISFASRWRTMLAEHRQEMMREEVLMRDGLIGDLDAQEKAQRLQARREELERELRDHEVQIGHDYALQMDAIRKRLGEVKSQQRQHREYTDQNRPVSRRAWQACVAVTGFFDMYEELEGDTESPTLVSELLFVVRKVVVGLGPSGLPLYAASLIQAALLDDQCEFAPDKCSCYSSPPPVVSPVTTLAMVFWVVCGVELGFHFLGLGYSLPQQAVRHAFYALYFALACATLFVLCTVCVWIVIGVFFSTVKMLPYAAAMLGLASVAALKHSTLRGFRERLDGRLWERTARSRTAGRLRALVQPRLYDLILRRRIQQALSRAGQSAPRAAAAVLLTVLLLGLLYGVLFVGFGAFSDPSDPVAGMLNSAILVALTVTAVQYSRATDGSESDELVHEAERLLARQVDAALATMCRLAVRARRFRRALLAAEARGGAAAAGGGESDSEKEEDAEEDAREEESDGGGW